VAANGLRFFGVFIRAALLWAVLWNSGRAGVVSVLLFPAIAAGHQPPG
jgi:hypothetical protein